MSRIIGITGGMAAGKSTLIEKLKSEKVNCTFVDVDCFRRNLFNDYNYVSDLKKVIPELSAYSKIDSLILNQYIYENEEYMKLYKEVLYKYLFSYLEKLDGDVVVEWALILQDNLFEKFSKVVYVEASDEVRLERLVDSDLSVEEIKKRFELQRNVDIEKYRDLDKFLVVDGEKLDISRIKDFIKPMECKFTIPEDGGKAIWEITHQCNYQCSYCIFSCNGKKIPGELSRDECFKVIDELVSHGFKHLKVTGGEPFLRSDIIDILEYASQRMVVDISTNASLITEEIVEKLNRIPLKMIHVSLDGNLSEHETVRGKNTYWRTIQGLSYLRRSKNKVRIGCVIHKENENNLEELVEMSSELSADEVIFSIMEPINGKDTSLVKTKSNEELIEGIERIKKKNTGIEVNYNFGAQPNYVCRCPAGDKFIYINHLGQVSPCTWLAEVDSSYISRGTFRDYTLDEMLDEEKIKTFVKGKRRGVCYGKI